MKRRINESDINRIAKQVLILKERPEQNLPLTSTGLTDILVDLIATCKKNPQTCVDKIKSVYLNLPPDIKQKVDSYQSK